MRAITATCLGLGILGLAATAVPGPSPRPQRGLEAVLGWTRTGPVERYNREGLYGYIDGGAELVLEYGFRGLEVRRYVPAAGKAQGREVTLEIYRMSTGEAAFGLFATKREGGERSWPGLDADNWVGPGQAGLVKGDRLVNLLAPDCDEREIGAFLAAVGLLVPGQGTARPAALDRLPAEGRIVASERYVTGPVAARNESPFLEGAFWGFAPAGGSGPGTAAVSAKYGAVPSVSKLVVVELGPDIAGPPVDDGVETAFGEYLRSVRRSGALVEGESEAGRAFLYRREGRTAVLALAEPDAASARGRIERVLGPMPPAAGGLKAATTSKPRLVVTFDTEDYISPAAEGIDDIPKWLAETMTEEGVTGTFFVIGEKARSLEKRGRRDVIAAMAKHDIGSHTSLGSVHPTVTEQLEKAGWDDGVALMAGQEASGIADLERIFGVPVRTLARHGGSYGPQLVAALGRLGAGYQGSPARLPGRDVVWFANALNFSAQYAGFDDAFYRDDLFEPVFDKLKKDWPELVRTSRVLALFAGHPTKIRAEEFWDLNFYGGKNTPPGQWVMPRLRPRQTMAKARENFRRLMRWIAERDDVEITTYRRLMDDYARQKGTMPWGELVDIAERTLATGALAPTDDFSPAEIFAALTRALTGFVKDRTLRDVPVVHPLGPPEMPPAEPEIRQVRLDDVWTLATRTDEHIGRTGALPAALTVGPARIGAGSLYALFARLWFDVCTGQIRQTYEVPAFEPYPRTNEKPIIDEVLGYRSWPVHKPDLDMSRIAEFTRLQLWTLKPATRS